jgi:acyl-CoA thioester hydrolase
MSEAHVYPIRIYYEDTDFSGNVYHAAYLKFFERGRTEFLRAMGVHHSELAQQGVAFAVRSMQIEFEAAAHIDDELLVETRVTGHSGARLQLEQTARRSGQCITRAAVTVVAIRTSGGAARLPRQLLAALQA